MMALEFSTERQQEIAKLLKRYPTRQAALLPVLWIAQEDFGHISDEAMELVARTLGLTPAYIFGVVTFYTMFYQRPVGKHHLEVCTNLSCSIMGAKPIVKHLEKRLGIKLGETTPDGWVTLSGVECLASCGSGPMLCKDRKEYIENLTEEKVDALIEEMKNHGARVNEKL